MGLLEQLFANIENARGQIKRRGLLQVPNMMGEHVAQNIAGPGLLAAEHATSVMPEVREPAQAKMLEQVVGLLGTTKPGNYKVFHGSSGNVSGELSKDAPKTTLGGFTKHGVSVSDDPAVASRYARDFHDAPAVYPLSLEVSKPLNLPAREFEKLQSLVGKIDRGEKLTELEDVGLEMLLSKYGVSYGGHPIDQIRKAGYDVINKDAGRYGMAEKETLVFDPKKLKFLLGK